MDYSPQELKPSAKKNPQILKDLLLSREEQLVFPERKYCHKSISGLGEEDVVGTRRSGDEDLLSHGLTRQEETIISDDTLGTKPAR